MALFIVLLTMASSITDRPRGHLLLLLLLLLLDVTPSPSSAQSSPPNNNNNPYFNNTNFNPSMAIVIVVLISAFFFLGFFSIYIRQCAGDRRNSTSALSLRGGAGPGRSRRNRGLDPDVLATFPTLVYSDVRSHKIGKASLECAVCLSEFEDDETLRLLPRCSHVFHHDCIDAWLAAHATCPVCRCDLSNPFDGAIATPTDPIPPQEYHNDHDDQTSPAPQEPDGGRGRDHVTIGIDDEDQERINNLERFVNMKRAQSRARPARFPRSHSTGHSLVLPGENLDRFTLRLPENIKRDLVERAEMMQRTRSLAAFPSEESSRRGYRGGSTRGTIRLGRSDRWGASLLRTLSTKMTSWGRRGEEQDGSTSARRGGGVGFFKRGDSMKGESVKGEGGSARGVRFNPVVDCYGGKGETFDGKGDECRSPTAVAVNKV